MVKPEENVVDLVFKQKLEQQAKIKKAKKLRKRRQLTIILVFFAVIYLYWSTDISKPKAISIKGNYVLNKEEVLKQSDINLDTMMVSANPFIIKRRLLKHPIIKDVNVKWSLLKRHISINVKEVDIFAYRQNDQEALLLMADGSHINLDTDYYQFLPHIIYVEGFNEKEIEERLISSFKDVDKDVKNHISEIHQKQVSFDDYYIELRMNDGNKVYTSFQTVAKVNYYFEILSNLKYDNTCIIIDEMSGEAYSQPCSELQLSDD